MPIQIVELELENWDGFDIHCPACGTVAFADGDPDPCQHVEFVEFSDGDICYVREDLEAVVDEWREETEAKDEEWDLVEALCERRDDSTSFVLVISWAGMPGTVSVGFCLGTPESDDESGTDDSGDQETSKQQTPPKRAPKSSEAAPKKAKDSTKRNSRAKRK